MIYKSEVVKLFKNTLTLVKKIKNGQFMNDAHMVLQIGTSTLTNISKLGG